MLTVTETEAWGVGGDEKMATKMKRDCLVAVDWENNGEIFWAALRGRRGLPRVLRVLVSVGGPDSVRCTLTEADEVLAYAERMPGWTDGPAYARNPIRVEKEV